MLTQERLKELLHYDPETGVFTRLYGNECWKGKAAGGKDEKGYVRVRLYGAKYRAHRLAWLYMTGSWPKNQIDHINRIKHDNRIDNLRDVNNSQNKQNNFKARSDNKSGFLGVCSHQKKMGMRYNAVITSNGVSTNLGWYGTPEEAHQAYLEAKIKHHEGCTI